MQLYYIRHAQSVNNALWEATGVSDLRSIDPELTELGYQQAQCLAQCLLQEDATYLTRRYDSQNLAGFGITHLYCSLMVRAIETALPVAAALQLPLMAWEDLHEEGGVYVKHPETGERLGMPGKSRAYLEEHYPDLVLEDAMNPQGWWSRPFEEREQRRDRALRVIARLLQKHGGTTDRVAWVSHGGFYYQFLSALLGLSEPDALTGPNLPGLTCPINFEINNVAISRIDFGEGEHGGINLVYLNRINHLPPYCVT